MPSGIEEAQVAAAAAQGDGQAFARLYDTYERRIYNFCLRIVGQQHDAEDATQETFIKVLGRLPDLQDRELNFRAYLFAAARNASYDVISRRKKTSAVGDFDDEALPLHGERPELDADPERAAMLESQRLSVQAANERLPARQREVLALREVEEMSYEEIAAVMDSNSNSVAQLISRARLRLRNEMQLGAGAAVVAGSKDCERALPLIAMRQDDDLDPGTDAAWLEAHLGDCQTCPVVVEAMSEAGISYRAWVPAIPAAYLFRDTLAKAAQSLGEDWSDVERPDSATRRGPSRQVTASVAGVVVILALLFTAIEVGESDLTEGLNGSEEVSAVTKDKQVAGEKPKTVKRRRAAAKLNPASNGSETKSSTTVPVAGGPTPSSGGGDSSGGGGSGPDRPRENPDATGPIEPTVEPPEPTPDPPPPPVEPPPPPPEPPPEPPPVDPEPDPPTRPPRVPGTPNVNPAA